jgi:hypothetical protein
LKGSSGPAVLLFPVALGATPSSQSAVDQLRDLQARLDESHVKNGRSTNLKSASVQKQLLKDPLEVARADGRQMQIAAIRTKHPGIGFSSRRSGMAYGQSSAVIPDSDVQHGPRFDPGRWARTGLPGGLRTRPRNSANGEDNCRVQARKYTCDGPSGRGVAAG